MWFVLNESNVYVYKIGSAYTCIYVYMHIYRQLSPCGSFRGCTAFAGLYLPCHTGPLVRVNVRELSTLLEGLTCALCTEKQLLPFLVCPPWPGAFSFLTPNNFSKQPPGWEC